MGALHRGSPVGNKADGGAGYKVRNASSQAGARQDVKPYGGQSAAETSLPNDEIKTTGKIQ